MKTAPKLASLCVLISLAAMADAETLKFKPKIKENEYVKLDPKDLGINPNDEGKLSNCGDKGNDFQFEYSPRILSSNMKLTITAKFKPEMDWSSGSYQLSVWIPQYPDSPIYDDSKSVNCKFFKDFVPGLCPFKKGKEFSVKEQTYDIDLPIQVPQGDYIIKLNVLDPSKQQFMCVNGTISFSGN